MDTGREDQEINRLERLENQLEHQEEQLHDTLHDMRRELDALEDNEREPFPIKVNNKSVTITGHEHTGLEIKQSAIAAGVKIQLDFVLSQEFSHNRSRIIGDEQRIRVERGACFEAIPNDDHS